MSKDVANEINPEAVLNVVEASIADLHNALAQGAITSVDLVIKYLQRIVTYDTRGPCLNAVVIFNPYVFDEAAASDVRRAKGLLRGPLDGVVYTLKDSMKYKGLTCANGSPAFEHLVAGGDSFVAQQLREAGAVLIGLTNTPPMMASGMHRGLYGRAESPYNLMYLTAAFSSGSSNGSATSTAASFAAFGLGSETVSSGRSPASNNALVAYTPSRTVISARGIWPLYPTCDVVVPHTRTVEDMLTILDVLAADDTTKPSEFWRQQQYVKVPTVRRPASYMDIMKEAEGCLQGKRIAVPKMFIGVDDPKAKPVKTSSAVVELWKRAQSDLEALGATVIETDFPLVTNYEDDSVSGEANNVKGFQPGWNSKERGELVAYLWDDFLKENGDPNYSCLASVDGSKMFPRPKDYIPDRYMEVKNFMNYPGLVDVARKRNGKSIWDIDGIAAALPSLEAQRKRDLEEWMDAAGIDVVVFPANGDVGKADLDTNDDSARHALLNGVKYSNGNRAIRHMGVPTVSVTMGHMPQSEMPVNLTFAGKHGQDSNLLQYAYAYEQHTKRRTPPPVTPPLLSDFVELRRQSLASFDHSGSSLKLVDVAIEKVGARRVKVSGRLDPPSRQQGIIDLYITGPLGVAEPSVSLTRQEADWAIEADFESTKMPVSLYGGFGQGVGKVMAIVRAQTEHGCTGKLVMLDQNAPVQKQEETTAKRQVLDTIAHETERDLGRVANDIH